MALIWSLPIVFLGFFMAGPVAAGLVSVLAVSSASIPGLDQRVPGIAHRGFSHTVWLSALLSGGAAAGTAYLWPQIAPPLFGAEIYPLVIQRITTLSAVEAAALVGGTLLATLLSHIVADTMTVGTGSYGVQPFWPISSAEVRFGFCTADSSLWNYGLLVIGVGITAGAAGLITDDLS